MNSFITKIGALCCICFCMFFTGCMNMDGFMFNSSQTDSYELPGNIIPSEYIEQVTIQSEDNTLYGYWVASDSARPGITMLYCQISIVYKFR